jgi:hypothetical protein
MINIFINSFFKYHIEKNIKIPCKQMLLDIILKKFTLASYEVIECYQGNNLQTPLEQGINAVLAIYNHIFEAMYALLRITISVCTIFYISSGSCALLLSMSLLFFGMHKDSLKSNSESSKQLQKTQNIERNKDIFEKIFDKHDIDKHKRGTI